MYHRLENSIIDVIKEEQAKLRIPQRGDSFVLSLSPGSLF